MITEALFSNSAGPPAFPGQLTHAFRHARPSASPPYARCRAGLLKALGASRPSRRLRMAAALLLAPVAICRRLLRMPLPSANIADRALGASPPYARSRAGLLKALGASRPSRRPRMAAALLPAPVAIAGACGALLLPSRKAETRRLKTPGSAWPGGNLGPLALNPKRGKVGWHSAKRPGVGNCLSAPKCRIGKAVSESHLSDAPPPPQP